MPALQGSSGYVSAIGVVDVPTPVPTRTTATVGHACVPVVTSLKDTEKLVVEPWVKINVVGARLAAGVRKLPGLPGEGILIVCAASAAPAWFAKLITGHPLSVHEPGVDLVSVKDV